MPDDSTTLNEIRIVGPSISYRVRDQVDTDDMWQLKTLAPSYKELTMDGPTEDGSVISSVDAAHPLRVLAMDSSNVPIDAPLGGGLGTQKVKFHVPRLVRATIYQPDGDAEVKLNFWDRSGKEKTIKLKGQPISPVPPSNQRAQQQQLGSSEQVHGTRTNDPEKNLVTVIVEPLPAEGDWEMQFRDHIDFPNARAVLGDIVVSFSQQQAKKLDWLKWTGQFRLTPDGIIFEATLPFPGANAALPGVFLLSPRETGATLEAGWTLRLLPERLSPDQAAAWTSAWNRILPGERQAKSVGMRGRRSSPPPAFTWAVLVDDQGKLSLSDQVEVPAADAQIILYGNDVGGTPDGVATLLAGVQVRNSSTSGMVEFTSSRKGIAPQSWTLTLMVIQDAPYAETFSLESVETVPGVPMLHDERLLASELRQAYALPNPKDDKDVFFGFVAVERGWLQVPLPNVPPRDTRYDQDLVPELAESEQSALDGFVRWSSQIPQYLLSAYGSATSSFELKAPWSVNALAAAGFNALIRVTPGAQSATLHDARVTLDNPQISTRGLLWVSQDRPDAIEALPRLGAGPGSFFDIPLETEKPPVPDAAPDTTRVVRFMVEKLTGNVVKQTLDQRSLRVTWNTTSQFELQPTVLWQRHPVLPLAATMPMTRSGGTSNRPLESRDLAPFVVTASGATSGVVTLASLKYDGANPFPSATPGAGDSGLNRHPDWTWSAATKNFGISFAALGVPGVEIVPQEQGGWQNLFVAARYDLPALDEAFATARIPEGPNPPAGSPPLPPPDPPVTALDSRALTAFWARQSQLQELTRVQDSYLFDFQNTATGSVAVGTLVAPATWTVDCGFDVPAYPPPANTLPYGQLIFTPAVGNPLGPFFGDGALYGLSDVTLKRVTDNKLAQDATGGIHITGWSPSTYTFTPTGSNISAEFDNRGFGSSQPAFDQEVHHRTVFVNNKAVDLVTATRTIPVKVGADQTYQLWFKDLPLTNKSFAAAMDAIDFSVWDAANAPAEGYEFRFFRSDLPDLPPGDDPVPFFGFGLSTLALLSLQTDANYAVQKASILVRLTLGQDSYRPFAGGNLARLDLAASAGGLQLHAVSAVTSLAFCFGCPVAENKAVRRMVALTMQSVSFEGLQLTLAGGSAGFEWYGADWQIDFDNVTLNASDTSIPFNKSLQVPEPAAGTAHLAATNVQLIAAPAVIDSKISFKSKFELGGFSGGIVARLDDAGKLSLLSYSIQAGPAQGELLTEGAGAFVRLFNAPAAAGSLCVGFPALTEQSARGLLAVSFGPRDSKSAPLPVIAGRLEMDIRANAPPDPRGSALETIRFKLEANNRDTNSAIATPGFAQWGGDITLYGLIRQTSAIAWPVQVMMDPADIPVKPKKGGSRVNVSIHTTGDPQADFAQHTITARFDGHILRLDNFAMDENRFVRKLNARWDTLVFVNHLLEVAKPQKSLSWSSVEPFSISTADELATLYPPDPHDRLQVTAFAARYEAESQFQPEDEPSPIGSMISPGFGRRCPMLAGADGLYFRQAFAAVKNNVRNLVMAAGFSGVLLPDGPNPTGLATESERRPLLRLPFLAELFSATEQPPASPLGPGALLQMPPDTSAATVTCRLNWADTTLLPRLVISARHAVSPRGASAVELLDTALAGSTLARDVPGNGDVATLRAAASVAPIIEQSFPLDLARAPRANPADILAHTPFWISGAGALSQLLSVLPMQKQAWRALSLVAGSVQKQGIAAVLISDPRPDQTVQAPQLPDALISLGQDLVEAALGGLTAGEGIGSAALAIHARPRVAVVRERSNGAVTYRSARLPLPNRAEIPIRPALELPPPRFAAPQRGYTASPFENTDVPAWLYPPVQGGMKALVDRTVPPPPPAGSQPIPGPSGVAGVRGTLALPRFVGRAEDQSGTGPRDAVWLAEKRVPPYLSLMIKDLDAAPIRWLSVAPPRARLPLAIETRNSLVPAGSNLDRSWRAFLPTAANYATVGERSGILTVRRWHLLAHLPSSSPFDPSVSRFGQPAQTGSSVIRQMRTPRPGPIPANVGNLQRDRRPYASALDAKRVARFLQGPVDALSGSETVKGVTTTWSVLATAMPETSGCVSDLWDGTIRVRFELSRQGDVALSTLEALWRWLFSGDDKKLQTKATLKIGTATQPYYWLRFLKSGPNLLDIILDPRQQPTNGPGAPLPLAAVLADSSIPVALHLTLHPGSNVHKTTPQPDDTWALSTDDEPLPSGATRSPVTIVFPLAPVPRSRGGLPLVPTTLVFRDPAYDRDLVNLSLDASKQATVVPADVPKLPQGRGALLAVLSVDRRAYEPEGAIAFMADLRMERIASNMDLSNDEFQQASTQPTISVQFAFIARRDGERRELKLTKDTASGLLSLSQVYEYSLARLSDQSGNPVKLEPGDMLELKVDWGTLSVTCNGASFTITVPNPPLILVPITAEPSTQPPPALYAAIEFANQRLSVPLHAQSPLAHRIDAEEMKKDLRQGVVRRKAIFAWYTARYQPESAKVYVLKHDRNGQTHLPADDGEFVAARRLE